MMSAPTAAIPSLVLYTILLLISLVKSYSFGCWRSSSTSLHRPDCCPRITSGTAFKYNSRRLTRLHGILDEVNSDAFDLSSTSKNKGKNDERFEIFLAELVFSPNDPRMDIAERYDQATDSEFLAWLDSRIQNTRDLEEKVALKDLYDMILDVQQKLRISQLAEERKRAQEAEEEALLTQEQEPNSMLTNADILRKAAQLDGSVSATTLEDEEEEQQRQAKKKKTFLEEQVSPEIKMSYSKLIQELLPPYPSASSLEQIVLEKYDQCDAQLLKILAEMNTAESQAVLDAIAAAQQTRIAAATEKLKTILAAREPMRMEGVIVKMAREGGIDEPLLLLLEANANQAEAAGALGPAQLMRRLRARAMEEKDKLVKSKEIALLRKLLRTENSIQREKILEDAFTPRERFLVPGTADNAMKAMEGEIPDQEKAMPDVPPPDFINACKAVMINFGNLGTEENGDLLSQIRQIASEAEVIATRIYGKGMSPREQQDRAWKETTTSIFDLEAMEIEAERMGETAPWANPDSNDIFPGFDADGKIQIGGR
mmetsp:Transcript_16949/g.24131  ORF Transcript_16949/g.24131 Transcript_16949/m.24131 type:complete len:542 (-) Transcript_16949:219-1844(-)